MVSIDPIQVLLWTLRRNERDVVNLYNSLSPLMQLAAGSNMLNFGYWNNASNPLEAQYELCSRVGKLAELDSSKKIADIGSGFSAPALYWKSQYESINIICVNTNFQQLKFSTKLIDNKVHDQKARSVSLLQTDELVFLNATSTTLPIADNSVDRVIALESAQHFKPLSLFVQESRRILKQNGLLVVAIPVIAIPAGPLTSLKLGILSFTWPSEHYGLNDVKSIISREGFQIIDILSIGSQVYGPLADYYIQNRKVLRDVILKEYPAYLENILYKSLLKMKQVSREGVIDYVLIKCNLAG